MAYPIPAKKAMTTKAIPAVTSSKPSVTNPAVPGMQQKLSAITTPLLANTVQKTAQPMTPTPAMQSFNTQATGAIMPQSNTGVTPAAGSWSGLGNAFANIPAAKPAAPVPPVTPAYGSNVKGYNETDNVQKQIADLGQAWATAGTPQEKAAIAAKSLALGTSSGGVRDEKTGTWTFPTIKMSATPEPVQAPTATETAVPTTPQSSTTYGQLTPDQIAAEARSRIERMITERTRIADQTKKGLQTSYDRLRTDVTQDRSLEDVTNQRLLNPFSGRSDYALGMVNMERGRTDREQQGDLQGRLANVDGALGEWLNQTPEQQNEIMNELTRIERDYGLQVGSLMGNFNGERTLAGDAQDWNKTVDEANLTGTFKGQKTSAQQALEWRQRFDYGNLTGQFGNGQQTMENKKFTYTQGRDKVADQQWEQEYNRRVEQDGIQNAIAWANNSLSADDNDRSWAELDAKTGQPAAYDGLSANQILDGVKSTYTELVDPEDPQSGKQMTKDPVKREEMFLDVIDTTKGMTDTQIRQILRMSGLTEKEIEDFKGKHAGN